jgi:hypothetical protein
MTNFPQELAENEVYTDRMERILKFHPKDKCTPPCPFHAPSDHHMTTWPIEWRADRMMVERICEHGIGHPDPDTLAYNRKLEKDIGDYIGAATDGIHGCDGCCAPPASL